MGFSGEADREVVGAERVEPYHHLPFNGNGFEDAWHL